MVLSITLLWRHRYCFCCISFHLSLSLKTAFVVPEDDGGYTVYCSNQWAQLGQLAVANILGIPNNK